MEVQRETLIAFRNKVDGLLKDLDSSPASATQITQQTLEPQHLGSGFAEAGDVHSAYSNVHAKLQELSKTLSDQIQAMTITIDIAHNGYQNVEESQIVNLWQIHDQTQTLYQQSQSASGAPATGTTSATPASTTGTAAPGSSGTSGTSSSNQGM
jgi:hypothetical protein